MLPTDAKERKAIPVSSGCFKYFPDALVAVAQLSAIANEQHNPGQPVHWAMEKSTDEADALARHQIQHVKGEMYDGDRVLHATKVAWRALAQLQRLLMSGVLPLRLTEWPVAAAEADGDTHLPPMQEMLDETGKPWGAASPVLPLCQGWGCKLPACREPVICGDCGADLDETGHFASCLSQAAHLRR